MLMGLALGVAQAAHATGLVDAYEAALNHDPEFAGAVQEKRAADANVATATSGLQAAQAAVVTAQGTLTAAQAADTAADQQLSADLHAGGPAFVLNQDGSASIYTYDASAATGYDVVTAQPAGSVQSTATPATPSTPSTPSNPPASS